jgi:hypothetical protein
VPFPELLTFHLAEAAEGKSPDQLLFGDDLDGVAVARDTGKEA